jgi:hypothetical protein
MSHLTLGGTFCSGFCTTASTGSGSGSGSTGSTFALFAQQIEPRIVLAAVQVVHFGDILRFQIGLFNHLYN